MIKPLYLDSSLAWQVRLDDGPALNISAPGRARSLYPLQRLARVISPSQAQWSTTALLACLRAGVPVIFHDTTGDPVGWCFGPRKRETTLGSLLREAMGLPQGRQLMVGWQQAAHAVYHPSGIKIKALVRLVDHVFYGFFGHAWVMLKLHGLNFILR